MTGLESLLPIFIILAIIMATYFYSVSYGKIRGHLSRTIKLGPILRLPILTLCIGFLIIMIAFTLETSSNIHHSIELGAMIVILVSSLSLNTNFKKISDRPLMIQLYLDNDMKNYDLFTISLEGNIPISPIIDELSSQALLMGKVVYLLGPQFNPLKEYGHQTINVGLPTHAEHAEEVSQYSPSELQIKISDIVKKHFRKKHIFFIGDFLDNLIEALDEEEFFKHWSLISSKVKHKHIHGIFFIQKDIHDPRLTRLIEQYADVSIELKEIENRGRLTTNMKVTNYKDDIRTNWFKV